MAKALGFLAVTFFVFGLADPATGACKSASCPF
jgi:hypothetical protein